MSSPPSSPSATKSLAIRSTPSTPGRSRKRTLDGIEKPSLNGEQESKIDFSTTTTPSEPNAKSTSSKMETNGFSGPAQSNPQSNNLKPDTVPSNGKGTSSAESNGQPSRGQDPAGNLGDYDWDDLQDRFSQAMDERLQIEEGIHNEFNNLINVSTGIIPDSQTSSILILHRYLRSGLRLSQ